MPEKLDASKFIGIPWMRGGESRRGADCWGLVRLVYREVLGVELRHASEISTDEARAVARRFEEVKRLELGEGEFRQLGSEEGQAMFDLVELAGFHIGIVISPSRRASAPDGASGPAPRDGWVGGIVLHTARGAGSALEDLRRMQVRSVYRLCN